jgi:hypothetical protein
MLESIISLEEVRDRLYISVSHRLMNFQKVTASLIKVDSIAITSAARLSVLSHNRLATKCKA